MHQPPVRPKGLLKTKFRRHGIYWLPNLITSGALFAGFYAIVQAMNGRFEQSAMAIFIAMVLDGLDGRVARFTRTQSAFGVEYDSLSDMVSFGAAPALIAYVWALQGMGRLGWVAAFVYCLGAALRLARFNTQVEVADKRFFQGMPSPAAACLVAGLVWAMNEYQIQGKDIRWLAWSITLFAGLTMVSNVPFYSGKDINLRKSVPFWVVVVIAFTIGIVVSFSDTLPELLFGLSVSYATSGYVIWVWRFLHGRRGARRPPGNHNPS
ncbi:MAG: CDP-diacylglycerol--serine O-phosphatidyltransferase [Burkholderiales bacterium]|nr:CDP-diacylglycerol--serine O-phosphatidyltransferase [Burkholderiales bacterium]